MSDTTTNQSEAPDRALELHRQADEEIHLFEDTDDAAHLRRANELRLEAFAVQRSAAAILHDQHFGV